MLDLTLKVTVLLALGWGVTRLMRRASAASRHAVWAAVCVAAIVLPVALLVTPSLPVTWWPDWMGTTTRALPEATRQVVDASAVVASGAAQSENAPGWVTLWVAAAALWVLGSVVAALRIAGGYRRVSRLAQRAVPMQDARVRGRASVIVGWLGVPHVRLMDTGVESMPAVCGVRTPMVLLPSSAALWSDERLDSVLVHECAHVQRRDAMWLCLAQAALTVWWWHPLMWLAVREMRVEREHASDDVVLAFGARASDYANDLVEMVEECDTASIDAAAAVAMARRTQLEGRVMAILNPDVNRNGRTRLATAVAVALVVGMAPLAALRAGAADTTVTPSAPQDPVRVGSGIREPIKIKHVAPKYPQEALDSRVEGIVVLEARINEDGDVTDARVLRPVALLSDAALEAVRQWRYMPTELNGQRVPVIITVTVSFRLGADGKPLVTPPPTEPADEGRAAFERELASRGIEPSTAPMPTWNPGDPPVRIGGQIKEPRKVKNVAPVYPAEAQSANVQGIVILEIHIDQDGRVTDARIVRPVALLDQAALDAVLQWEFEPTLLNGQPVPVIMTVTVNFTLK
jgi:TonB family protein